MDQQNNGNTGAPSTDTTSALFVSARKKQIEQQEAERQAKEREAERLAAEAEVRRLEQEVVERRLRAQEEAQRVEQEAAIRRQQAQQAAQQAEAEAAIRQQQAQKAEQDAARMRAAQPMAHTTPVQSGAQKAKRSGLPLNKWVMIGGGAALLLAVILIVVLSGGGGSSVNAKNFTGEVSSADGFTLSYPEDWFGDTLTNNGMGLYLQGDDGLTVLAVMDVTNELNVALENGVDAVSAAEGILYDIAGIFASGSPVTDMEPELKKSGISVQGSADFHYQNGSAKMQGAVEIESIEGARTVITAYAIPEGKTADKQAKTCKAILGTLMIGDPGDGGMYGAETPYWESDARFAFYSEDQSGIQAYIPAELEGRDNVILADADFPFSSVSFGDKLMLIDFTGLYQAIIEQGGSLTNVVDMYLDFMVEANGEMYDGVLIDDPVADATGTRINFSFDMDGVNLCALRLFHAEDVCMIAIGHDLSVAEQDYFYVMADSMCVAVG